MIHIVEMFIPVVCKNLQNQLLLATELLISKKAAYFLKSSYFLKSCFGTNN